jgi:hypothetical protein
MNFWTRDEYKKFIELAKSELKYYQAFQILYWCGLRGGELLALTHADIDTGAKTITINKSYQRIHGEDVITDPKTKKSNRVVTMPDKLASELAEYKEMFYQAEPTDRLFPFFKSRLYPIMSRYAVAANVKRIRIHDLRHSHVSLLIDMGVLARGDSGARRSRKHRNHVSLRAYVSVEAIGNGVKTERGDVVREFSFSADYPCMMSRYSATLVNPVVDCSNAGFMKLPSALRRSPRHFLPAGEKCHKKYDTLKECSYPA